MMDLTLFLSQIWGPVLLAFGVGVFVSRPYYVKLYRNLKDETLAALTFGMMAMAAGIAQVMFHNVWDTLPQVIISLLGWGLLIKGALFVIAPKWVDAQGAAWAKANFVPLASALTLIVGAYLTWIAYLV